MEEEDEDEDEEEEEEKEEEEKVQEEERETWWLLDGLECQNCSSRVVPALSIWTMQ